MLLRDLISFVQFKKREELPWRSVDFSYFYSFMGVFHILQIVETVPNSFNLLSILTDEDCGSWKWFKYDEKWCKWVLCQLTFTCSKSAIETLEKRCEICSKLTIKAPGCHWRCSSVFIVNFEHISHLFLVFLMVTLSK